MTPDVFEYLRHRPGHVGLKKVTEGLYYPAALTCGFLAVALRAKKVGVRPTAKTVEFWLAITLIFYFSICFVHTTNVEEQQYSWVLFTLDLLEACIIGFMLDALGYLETSPPSAHGEHPRPTLGLFYLLLLVVLLLQVIWQEIAQTRPGHPLIYQGILAAIFAVIGCATPKRHVRLHWLIAIALAVTVANYFVFHAAEGPTSKDKTLIPINR